MENKSRIDLLKAELRAIALWDEHYRSRNIHDEVDNTAFAARQARRLDILRLLGAVPSDGDLREC